MNPSPYSQQSMGGKLPLFEVDARRHVSPLKVLAREVESNPLESGPRSAGVTVDIVCPDARIVTVLDVGWVPFAPGGAPGALATDPTLWLAAAVDLGGGPQPSENLWGTKASPLPFMPTGLWHWSYSPTEEVEALLASFRLIGPQIDGTTVPGEWRARARWTALYPMSEIDWRDAIGRAAIHAIEGMELA